MTWIGRKKLAFIPVHRPNPATGVDRSFRAYISLDQLYPLGFQHPASIIGAGALGGTHRLRLANYLTGIYRIFLSP